MSYFSDLHITGQDEGRAGMHAQLVRDFMRLGRTPTEARAAADEILAPKAKLAASVRDDRAVGSPCCPKCEMCGRALDECRCFGGDDE